MFKLLFIISVHMSLKIPQWTENFKFKNENCHSKSVFIKQVHFTFT